MPKTTELRTIKPGQKFRLPGCDIQYVRGQYDRSTREFFAREVGRADTYKFPATAEVAA